MFTQWSQKPQSQSPQNLPQEDFLPCHDTMIPHQCVVQAFLTLGFDLHSMI